MKRLGVFGGTFNPIHTGHLIIAQDIRERFELEKLVFIPASTPPHKDNHFIISPQHRFRMISLAIESNPHFEVSEVEISRGGRSYTVDTLATLRGLHPELARLIFIMGLDQALEIQTWKDADRLFSLAEILVVSRPGFDISALSLDIRKKVQFLVGRSIDISSTEIRTRVRAGESIAYLVPKEVERYIYEKGLYSARP